MKFTVDFPCKLICPRCSELMVWWESLEEFYELMVTAGSVGFFNSLYIMGRQDVRCWCGSWNFGYMYKNRLKGPCAYIHVLGFKDVVTHRPKAPR